jgi:hypothetical protein
MGSELLQTGMRRDFEVLLLRTLRGLPDPLLAALLSGLEQHGDELMPGRLYRSPTGGGCAVGLMVRELDPAAFETGRLRFWLRHGWRRAAGGYGGVLASCPRVRHLEYLFDRSVASVQAAAPGTDARTAARSVGSWLTAQARVELGRRHDDVPAWVPAAPSRTEVADALV